MPDGERHQRNPRAVTGNNGGPPLDPINLSFDLHERQGDAFLSHATELLYGGAAGGGKSHLMRVSAVLWCLEIPGLQVYMFRRTYPDLMSNHMEGEGSFPELLGPLVKEKMVKILWSNPPGCYFDNGSAIFLRHAQHEKDVFNYQGSQMHVLMIDELTQWSKKMYTYLRSRLRKTKMLKVPPKYEGHFPRIISSANPGGIGHNWVKMDFVDNAEEYATKQMGKRDGGMLRQFIPARLEDNPSLDVEEYEGKLEGIYDEALARAMREGDWNIVAGGYFDDIFFRNRKYIVIASFDIPPGWRIDRSFDWGSSRPFSVGWWAESDGSDVMLRDGTWRSTVRGDLFRIYEWYGWKDGQPDEGLRISAAEVAQGIVEREIEWGIYGRVEDGPADSSIFDKENNVCIADDMSEPVRVNGREYPGIEWERADKSPGSVKLGLVKMREMYTNAAPPKKGVRERAGMFIFARCNNSLRVIPSAPRDEMNREILDKHYEDHIIDETRYRARFTPSVMGISRTRGNR
jgi:hypothetical protein